MLKSSCKAVLLFQHYLTSCRGGGTKTLMLQIVTTSPQLQTACRNYITHNALHCDVPFLIDVMCAGKCGICMMQSESSQPDQQENRGPGLGNCCKPYYIKNHRKAAYFLD
ncbi:hypothetical protein XENTR_v10008557 [Xenopus tropicalis]|nr:hypothetical protein XENTR_v10008557 [Xenopus tropicalis]